MAWFDTDGSTRQRQETSASPVQLLKVQRADVEQKWSYELCQEGLQLLEKHGSRPISVASICGLYRTGKSYLLNLLSERVQKGQPLFKVGGTNRACTEGLWLWGCSGSDDPRTPLLVFIDCEGFGSSENDRTRDAQLMTLCSLLSSVLVLNTRGALSENVFNTLALTCRFAEHIEERGNEASRPALLWVLRDFVLELQDPAGRAITPDAYLEQVLHASPLVGQDKERAQGAVEVRSSLLRFFKQRGCATLVQPLIDEEQLQQLENLPFASLRAEFRSGVESLRKQLTDTCLSNPKTVGSRPLGCSGFAALLQQLVVALNTDSLMSVKGAWETVQHSACGGLADELRSKACAVLRSLAAGQQLPSGEKLPLRDDTLQDFFNRQRQNLKQDWDARAIGDEMVRREYWQEIEESLTHEEALVRLQNASTGDQRFPEVLTAWREWLKDSGGKWPAAEQVLHTMSNLMEQMPAQPLARAARTALEDTAQSVVAGRDELARLQRELDTIRAERDAVRAELDEAHQNLEDAKQQRRCFCLPKSNKHKDSARV